MWFYGNGWEAQINDDNSVVIYPYGGESLMFYNQDSVILAKSIIKKYCDDYHITKGILSGL